MSRVFCVWELGEDMGHLARFAAIADELLSRGHEVVCALKDLSRAHQFFEGKPVKLLQSPIWLPRLKEPFATHSFAEILSYKGYQSPQTLKSLVRTWASLFDLVDPDLIIFDHAPTALLAARGRRTPRVICSAPFATLAPGFPLASLHSSGDADNNRVIAGERGMTTVINQVLLSVGMPQVSHVSDMFEAEATILRGVRELDLYRDRRKGAIYVGALEPKIAAFQEPQWRNNGQPKIFVYLKQRSGKSIIVLEALARADADIVCYYAGATVEFCQQWQASMFITNTPINLDMVLDSADMIVCHGGIGVVSSALQAGLPLLIAPTQLEQTHTALLLQDLGVATVVQEYDDVDALQAKLAAMLGTTQYLERAQRFSQVRQAVNSGEPAKIVGDICDSLLRNRAREL